MNRVLGFLFLFMIIGVGIGLYLYEDSLVDAVTTTTNQLSINVPNQNCNTVGDCITILRSELPEIRPETSVGYDLNDISTSLYDKFGNPINTFFDENGMPIRAFFDKDGNPIQRIAVQDGTLFPNSALHFHSQKTHHLI